MQKKHIHSMNSEYKLDKDTPFAVTEAYKTVRTNIIFSMAADGHKTFVVSSSNQGEGKSTTSANLAITLAQTSARVLLIDGDLRKPVQHKIFGVDNSHGLSKFLVGLESLSSALHANIEPRLDLLTAGPTPPNPSELLGSKNMTILLEKLEEHYDYIIIDSPPVNVVSDVLVVSAKTAGVVLVAKQGTTTYDDIGKAIDSIKFAGANVLGVILTNVEDLEKGRYYKNYRGYSGYGAYVNQSAYDKEDINKFAPEPVQQQESHAVTKGMSQGNDSTISERSQTVFQRRPEE